MFDGSTKCWRPSRTTSADIEPRLQTAQFGDGYLQRVIDGINGNKTTYNVEFAGKYDDEINAMNTYLRGLKGNAFPFLDPFTGAVFNVFCDKWTIAKVVVKADGSWIGNLTAQFYTANGAGMS
jgi:phage-related protein